jgi:hypothetical protein
MRTLPSLLVIAHRNKELIEPIAAAIPTTYCLFDTFLNIDRYLRACLSRPSDDVVLPPKLINLKLPTV